MGSPDDSSLPSQPVAETARNTHHGIGHPGQHRGLDNGDEFARFGA
jgi:hypothetical protein